MRRKLSKLLKLMIWGCLGYSLMLAVLHWQARHTVDAFWCLGLTLLNAQFLLMSSIRSARN